MRLFNFLQTINPAEKICVENMDTREITVATVGNMFTLYSLKEFKHLYLDGRYKIKTAIIENEIMIKLQIIWN